TANLNVVAAWKIILAVVLPPGNVHVHAADAIVIVRRDFGHFRNVAPAVASDGVCEVAADPTGRVGKTVGEQFGLGIEEKTSGFTRACRNDDGAGEHTLFGTRGFMDVRNASSSAIGADEDFARHRACDQSE